MNRSKNTLVLLIISLISLNTLIVSGVRNDDSNKFITNSIVNISNFDDFTLLTDNSYVQSTKATDHITFNYNGTSSEPIEREQYLLALNEQYGNCSDFLIEAEFNYTMSSVNDRLTFRIFAGSNYFENGSFAGIYPADSGGSPSKLVGGGIWDAWSGHTGKYVSISYPNNTKVSHSTADGTLSINGSIKVQLARDIDGTYSRVINMQSSSTMINSTWTENLNRDVHYILIDFYSGDIASNVSLSLNYLNATLLVDGLPITFPTNLTNLFPLNTLTISISIVFGLGIITILRKKKKSH